MNIKARVITLWRTTLSILHDVRERRVARKYVARLMATKGEDQYALRAMIDHVLGRRIYTETGVVGRILRRAKEQSSSFLKVVEK